MSGQVRWKTVAAVLLLILGPLYAVSALAGIIYMVCFHWQTVVEIVTDAPALRESQERWAQQGIVVDSARDLRNAVICLVLGTIGTIWAFRTLYPGLSSRIVRVFFHRSLKK